MGRSALSGLSGLSAVVGGVSDIIAPTVEITSTQSVLALVNPIPVTITFSEVVTGFAVGDITVGNGSAGNFSTVDNIVFTADITPTVPGVVTVDVEAGVCIDLASNPNEAAAQFSIVFPAVYESFTGANGTTLPAHIPNIAPVGSSWDNVLLEIQSNHASIVGANNRQRAIIESGVSDCVITLDASYSGITGTTYPYYSGIVFRATDTLNFWLAGFNIRTDNTGYQLWEVVAGVGTSRASLDIVPDLVDGTVYPIKVTINGTGISVLLNNTYVLSYTSSFNQAATKHGLNIGFGGANAIADNFKVSPL